MPIAVTQKPNRDSNIDRQIYQMLDLVGDGSGADNANVDGSSTPVAFKIVVPENQCYEIHRMIIHIADNGKIESQLYGALPKLTNGVTVELRDADDSLVHLLSNGEPVDHNCAWGALCYDMRIDDRGAGVDGFVNVRWTFEKSGEPLRLTEGQYLQIIVNDNLTGLIEHHFMIHGRKV